MAEEQAQAPANAAGAKPASGGKPILFIGLALFNMAVVIAVGLMIYMGNEKEAAKPGIDDVIQGEAQAQADAYSQEKKMGSDVNQQLKSENMINTNLETEVAKKKAAEEYVEKAKKQGELKGEREA